MQVDEYEAELLGKAAADHLEEGELGDEVEEVFEDHRDDPKRIKRELVELLRQTTFFHYLWESSHILLHAPEQIQPTACLELGNKLHR